MSERRKKRSMLMCHISRLEGHHYYKVFCKDELKSFKETMLLIDMYIIANEIDKADETIEELQPKVGNAIRKICQWDIEMPRG